jgi:hypothetical protein
MAGQQIPIHPLLEHLTQDSATGTAETPVKLSGYVGRASREGLVRLYSTLEDLSHYLEFDQAGIVQTADTPESILPNQAVTIWVKPRTPICWVREYSTATALVASILTSLGLGTASRGSNPNWMQ